MMINSKFLYSILSTYLIFIVTANANETARFRVVDADRNHVGVEAELIKVTKSLGTEVLTYSGKDGYVVGSLDCEHPEKIQIVAEDFDYHERTLRCPVKTTLISLSSVTYAKNLALHGSLAEMNGNWGSAALAYSEVAYRFDQVKEGSIQSNIFARKAYQSAGYALGVTSSVKFDPLQNKDVMTPELKRAVLSLQKDQKLKETGLLDFNTLNALSEENVMSHMFIKPKGELDSKVLSEVEREFNEFTEYAKETEHSSIIN